MSPEAAGHAEGESAHSARLRTGLGHGKLLLFGEHAAVYGHPACGLTLPWTITVHIRTTGSGRWEAPGLDQRRQQALAGFLEHSRELFLDVRDWGGSIIVESEVPEGVGFGSSAAWSVAFVNAMTGPRKSLRRRWELAHRAEGYFHGTPSGIDTGLALLDGLYAFRPSPPAVPSASRLPGVPLHLLVGSLPRVASTRELVAILRERLQRGEGRAAVEELGKISGHAIRLLGEKAAETVGPGLSKQLGTLAVEAHGVLQDLGLSTREVDLLLAAGRDAGAVGGKISGAGGGGAFYLMFSAAADAPLAVERLKREARRLGVQDDLVLIPFDWNPAGQKRV